VTIQTPDATKVHRIELHVTELRQLLNSFDPSPFQERDLDPRAEEHIVAWSRELPRHEPFELFVYLDRTAGLPNEEQVLRDAIHQHFAERSRATERQLKQLFHRGRISLAIGLAFLTASVATSRLIENMLGAGGYLALLEESVLIGGWVAMWRPLEIFLYDWWPIRADARLYERLAAMRVCIKYAEGPVSDAWQRDWPAAPPSKRD
jgi:hypothetical protein